MKKIFIFTVLIMIVFIAGGCKKKTQEKIAEQAWEKAIETQTGENMDVDIDKGGEVITFEDKETGDKVMVGTTEVPKSWPNDIPLYSKDVVAVAESNEGINLTIQTEDDLNTVKEWYEEKMLDNKWIQESVFGVGQMWNASYKNSERILSIMITIPEDEPNTNITLVYTK